MGSRWYPAAKTRERSGLAFCRGSASIEHLLSVRFDCAVRCGAGHASEHETGVDLVLVEKSLIVMVDTAADQLAGA
jgi:hypothetical protein